MYARRLRFFSTVLFVDTEGKIYQRDYLQKIDFKFQRKKNHKGILLNNRAGLFR
jgi:hypothetical protein